MKATVLVDNISNESLKSEWGLSIFIEYEDKNILLDTGASNIFIINAKKLGIDISNVDFAVLSHAHYDHADGMKYFFCENKNAKFYFRQGIDDKCYFKKWFIHKYIGIPKNIHKEYEDRIIYPNGDCTLAHGISLIPHKTPGLYEIGKKNNMYIRKDKKWIPDDFSHEQSLVFDTTKGLVIFNSCSHGGADNIINEVKITYPNRNIRALIGGFHIFNKSESQIRELAQKIKATGVEEIYTGHCTGEKSFKILKEELGNCVHQLSTGLVMEF